MKILVTGSSGFLGKKLCESLSGRNKIIRFDRGGEGKNLIKGDITNPQDVAKAFLQKPDVVFHLAAILDETSPDLYRVNVEGTKNVLEESMRNKVKRFILVGPVGVLGESKEPLTEKNPYKPETIYEKSKVRAEELVKQYYREYGLNYTIVRLTIIYGNNSFWRQIISAAKNGYPLIGDGKNYWHLVYIDDAVKGLCLMLKDKAKNQIYNLAGPDPHTYEETYNMINKTLGIAQMKKHVPVYLANSIALANEIKFKLTGQKPDVTKVRASITRLIRNRVVSIEKAKKELGFKPSFNLPKGMKKTVSEVLRT
jgi:nucleoside-diphosphate-sugar epimerase